jgi:pilus assembly protein CpaC
MSQQSKRRTTPLRGALALLAMGLAALCTPQVAHAQEETGDQPAISRLPETDAKVTALIAEVLEPEVKIEVSIHHSKLIRTKVPITRFSITEPKTLDVVQFSPTEFELIGLKPGQTTLTLWFGDNQALRYLVRVASEPAPEKGEREYKELEKKLNEMFPNSMVQLIPLADKLIIRGQAKDSQEATQILSLLSKRGGYGTAGRGIGAGRMINLGEAADPKPGVKGKEAPPAHDVINLLNVAGEQQIMLKVRIAQLDRTALRQMSAKFKINSGILSLNNTSGGLSAVFSSVLTSQDLELALTAVNSTTYTKVLAEPNLVTLNGQSASFISGGEFPVPTAVGIGGVSGINTQFQKFGTQLTFTPTIIDQDRIRLKVAPSFSQRDESSQDVQGIPSLRNQAVTTEVDLRAGQWLAIGGLLQDQQEGSKKRVPFVGDLPVVGTLFGQTSSARHETELIVLVSPELVHPMDAQETPMILPGMEVAEPGDFSFFIGGSYIAKAEGVNQCSYSCPSQPCSAEASRQASRETMARPEYQRSEKYYVYGPHGTSQ